jgi:hypothetical protein
MAERHAAVHGYVVFLLVTFPVWGLVALLWLLSLLPRGANTPGELIIFLGAVAPFVGVGPIFRMSGTGVFLKLLLFVGYYVGCTVVMFVVGWACLGIFGLFEANLDDLRLNH